MNTLVNEINKTQVEPGGLGIWWIGLTIPMHYDMFTINTADINEFRRIADKHNLRFLIMDHAGYIHFPMETNDGP